MKKILILLGLIVISACSLQPMETGSSRNEISLTNTTPPNFANRCQQKGYTWNADSSCRYEEISESLSIKINYPIELLPSPLIESTIDNYIADYRSNFMQAFEEGYVAGIAPWIMEIRFIIYHHSPSIISIRFDELYLMGGPHHNITLKSFTFDTAANTLLSFEDLFLEGIDPVASIIPLVRPILASNMSARRGMTVDISDRGIVGGTSELAHFRNFALTDSHLLIFFETNQVASYIEQDQIAEIPLSDLAGILRDF